MTATPMKNEQSGKLPVRTKRDFVRRYMRGEFGNRSPTWGTLPEFNQNRMTNPRSLYHIRNRRTGGETWYNVPYHDMVVRWQDLVMRKKVSPYDLYISEMAPTEKTVFQGEVQTAVGGIQLMYTTVAKPMRPALEEESVHVEGITAWQILRMYLCHNSFEWLRELLDNYPDHVIEFSTYSTNWGTLPNYNTVFWEVRLY